MKNLTASLVFTLAIGLAGCSSTSSGPANYSDADRGPTRTETTTTTEETTVSTPTAAPIPTKSGAGNDVLDHNTPDQQMAHP